jgi:hypothetical protein
MTKLLEQAIAEICKLPEAEQDRVAAAILRDLQDKKAQLPLATLGNFEDEPFFGMWRDRKDMADSSAWVRQMRKQEWKDHH